VSLSRPFVENKTSSIPMPSRDFAVIIYIAEGRGRARLLPSRLVSGAIKRLGRSLALPIHVGPVETSCFPHA
jgi:hypothetical protein